MRNTVDDRQAHAVFGKLAATARKPPMRAVAAEMDQAARNTFPRETGSWGHCGGRIRP